MDRIDSWLKAHIDRSIATMEAGSLDLWKDSGNAHPDECLYDRPV